jgi:hypothetical protein
MSSTRSHRLGDLIINARLQVTRLVFRKLRPAGLTCGGVCPLNLLGQNSAWRSMDPCKIERVSLLEASF